MPAPNEPSNIQDEGAHLVFDVRLKVFGRRKVDGDDAVLQMRGCDLVRRRGDARDDDVGLAEAVLEGELAVAGDVVGLPGRRRRPVGWGFAPGELDDAGDVGGEDAGAVVCEEGGEGTTDDFASARAVSSLAS
jgi:hypothetical protein